MTLFLMIAITFLVIIAAGLFCRIYELERGIMDLRDSVPYILATPTREQKNHFVFGLNDILDGNVGMFFVKRRSSDFLPPCETPRPDKRRTLWQLAAIAKAALNQKDETREAEVQSEILYRIG